MRCGDIPTARVDSKLKQDQKRGETPQKARETIDEKEPSGMTACRQQQNAAEREGTPPNLRRTDEYAEDQNRYEIDHAVEADLTEILVSAGDCHCGR